MKKLSVLFVATLFCILAFAQQYGVQVAAFDQRVNKSYFSELSHPVRYELYKNNIHVYFIDGLSDMAEAVAIKNEAVNRGFTYARVVDFVDIARKCEEQCGISIKYTEEDLRLESIFFDFDRYNLRSKSKAELNKLYRVLNKFAGATAQLKAHTDAKGSNEYNETLSLNRANAAKNYLIQKGISSSRIHTSTFGEVDPIAKNEINGRDTPTGRQYNRRVQISVLDSDGTIMNIVDSINVPTGLQ